MRVRYIHESPLTGGGKASNIMWAECQMISSRTSIRQILGKPRSRRDLPADNRNTWHVVQLQESLRHRGMVGETAP